MSLIADDVVNFTSMLKITYNFLAGREFLKRKKFREKKKLISVALPYSDLAFAAGAIPVFPIRMQIFDINKYLMVLNSATTFLGWNTVVRFLGFVKQFDALKVFDNVINEVINSINMKYNEMYDLGVKNGLSEDLCYGIKALYGMHYSKGKNVDACLNFTIRCSAYNKYLELIKKFVPKQIWVDVPPRNLGNTLEIVTENLTKAIEQLEELTGNVITDNSLNKQFRIGNQVKRFYKTILFEISTSDFYPCNPATFAEILALLSITFQDYNSDANRYLENLSQLVREMKERIRKGIGMDVSKMPKVLLTPMFGGWEPITHEYIYEMGGRTIYADWWILKYLDEILVNGHSNPIENYAQFLINLSSVGFGCDNSTLTESYLKGAKELKADGIVFNQVFGCHSISNCYTLLKEKIRRYLEIPSIFLNFNKIGENVEQVKTRLGAFMEMLTA
ncbi:MAG: 2-hydroxyacyl-CoA dehydratase [Promethearchaeia archaeon]